MPYRTRTIESPLAPAEVEQRLRAMLRPEPSFLKGLEEALSGTEGLPPFSGTVDATEFKLSRVVNYRNNFLPVIRGTYARNEQEGTTIRLRMHIEPVAAGFMLFLFAFGARSVIAALIGNVSNPEGLLQGAAFVFGIGTLVMSVGFYPEAKKAERLIREAVADRQDSSRGATTAPPSS